MALFSSKLLLELAIASTICAILISLFDLQATKASAIPTLLNQFWRERTVFVRSNFTCDDQYSFGFHLFSVDPLVIYLKNFVTPDEASELVRLSAPSFALSQGWSQRTMEGSVDSSTRSSVSAIPPAGSLSECISRRATSFLGWDPLSPVQTLYIQQYTKGGQYVHHYDWYPDEVAMAEMNGNRDATFLIYLEADKCEGGGTNFPRLEMPDATEWCQFIECPRSETPETSPDREGERRGVTFRPIVGNGIFWLNLRSNGSGHLDTLHAGLPVTEGSKTGLNIWTWRRRASGTL